MAAIPLEEVPEEAATGHIRETFEDIKGCLRVTTVNLLYRTLAKHPAYLVAAWDQLRPNVTTLFFERVAEKVRRTMVPPLSPDLPNHEEELEELGYTDEQIRQVGGVIDVFNYVNPKNLIVASALKASLEGFPVGGVKPGDARELEPLPEGPPEGMETPTLVGPDEAQGQAREAFEALRAWYGGSAVGSVYRALGRWPEYLARAVDLIVRETQMKGFDITVNLSQQAALSAAQQFPFPIALSREKVRQMGYGEEEVDLIGRKLDRFILFIPRTNTSLLILRAALLGEGRVKNNPFPLPQLR
ncbi:MAG: halocarboxylic acid dehydrogenase DehI family protein [Nitrospinota bacterium]